MSIAHVQTQSTEVTSDPIAITYSNFAVGSGTNRSLIAYVLWKDESSTSPAVSSVVFNTSENFTYGGVRGQNSYAGGNFTLTSEIWYLDNPSNATADVIATLNETADGGTIILAVSEYTGANNGIGSSPAAATGNNDTPTVTLTTDSSGNLIVMGAAQGNTNNSPYTPGSGTTERLDYAAGTDLDGFAGEEASSGGSDTIDCTSSTSNRWAAAAIELKAAGVAAGQPMMLRATTVPHMRKWTPSFFFWPLILAQLQARIYARQGVAK
jgi:hypothetical protein